MIKCPYSHIMSGLPAQWCCFISPWLSSASYTATPALHNNSKQLGVVRSAVSEEAAPQVFFPPARSVYAKLTFNTSQVTENVVLFFLSLFRRCGWERLFGGRVSFHVWMWDVIKNGLKKEQTFEMPSLVCVSADTPATFVSLNDVL